MTYLFVLALILSSLIKIIAIWGNNFGLTPYHGRDVLDGRQMVVTHISRLVCPTTSINGVLLGPFYYYFITVPFVLFKGDPAAIVIWQIVWFQIAVLFIWYVLKKKSLSLANLTGILLLLSPVGFYTGRYFWNANAMPIFTILFFGCLFDTVWHKNNLRLITLGLIAGFSLQIEAAFGLLFIPFALLICFFKKFSFIDLLKITLAFAVTLLPQILFEFRHQFLMTKTLIAGLSGKSDVLGEKLTFLSKLSERQELFFKALRESNHINFEMLGPIFLVVFLLAIYYTFSSKNSKTEKDMISISFHFLVFAGLFYLCFPQHVKGWYVLSLSISVIFLLSGVLSNLYHQSRLGPFFVWLFIIYSFYHTLLSHTDYLARYALKPSSDPSNMANELRAIDWVYSQADGQPFKVYSYLPSIYDYPYQYLFWCYGTK